MKSKFNNNNIKNRYKIFYIYENSIIIILLGEDVKDINAFAFLNEVKNEILKNYSVKELMSTNSSQLNKGKDILKQKMKYYNRGTPVATSNGQPIDNLNLLKDIVIQNINTLIERDQKTEMIVHKSENLGDVSNTMMYISQNLRNKESERKNKFVVMIISLFIVILILIYIFAF